MGTGQGNVTQTDSIIGTGLTIETGGWAILVLTGISPVCAFTITGTADTVTSQGSGTGQAVCWTRLALAIGKVISGWTLAYSIITANTAIFTGSGTVLFLTGIAPEAILADTLAVGGGTAKRSKVVVTG